MRAKATPTIADDIEAGEEPLSLSRALHLKELMVAGQPHNITWIHRAIRRGCRGADGNRVVLETTILFGKYVTTRSSVLPSFAGRPAAQPTAETLTRRRRRWPQASSKRSAIICRSTRSAGIAGFSHWNGIPDSPTGRPADVPPVIKRSRPARETFPETPVRG